LRSETLYFIKDRLRGPLSYKGFYFWHCPKVTKGLGPKPPKAEKPDAIPKIRKLATLKQYGFFNGIPPGFSPAAGGVTGVTRVAFTLTRKSF